MSLSGISKAVEQQIETQSDGQESKSGMSEQEMIIQEQLQAISTLQSRNQQLQSKLTSAQYEIEKLTSRAAAVNETELRNRKLLKEAEEARAMRDKALNEAMRERADAESARADARRAVMKANQEIKSRVAAEKAADDAKLREMQTREKYRVLFIGIVIFLITVAILAADYRQYIFPECGMWFADRWRSFVAVYTFCKNSFISSVAGMNTGWGLHIAWCYVLAIVILALLLLGMGALMVWVFLKLKDLVEKIGCQYSDGMLKAIISVSAVISLFYVCLYLYEDIKAALPLNIFSVWFISSGIACLAMNFPEIRQGFKDWR